MSENKPETEPVAPSKPEPAPTDTVPPPPAEIGGRKGPEPTRFNDWEKGGRCIDF